METTVLLKAAKAAISDEHCWGKGECRDFPCALDALRVSVDMDEAHPDVVRARFVLSEALPIGFEADPNDWNHPVAQFNDDPATTHDDVMALYDRAISAAA